MSKRIYQLFFIVAMSLGFASQSAWALFEAHGLVGKRWYDIDGSGAQATIFDVEAYFTLPIPMITLGFGPGYEMNMVREGDTSYSSVDTATISKISAKVLAGVDLPLTGLGVYGKLGYTFMGNGLFKGDSSKTEFSVSGTNLSLGLRYKLAPFVGLLLEANMGQEKLTDYKIDGVKIGDGEFDAKSTAVMLGVNVGI